MKILFMVALLLVRPAAIATTWATTSTEEMLRSAGLVAVCQVVRYPCNETNAGHSVMPGYIKLKVIQIVRGTESDPDLLVEWVDFTADPSIKEGMQCVVFLWRGEAGRKVDYWGVPTNATYSRFNSNLWFREITNGKIKWTGNRSITIAQLSKIVNSKAKPTPAVSNR